MTTAPSVEWLPFVTHPQADSCWSVTAAADGRVYAAACCEHTPGGTVQLVRYDGGQLAPVVDVAAAVEDPPSSGRASQCKIHYSLCPSRSGILYGATHLSAPPLGATEPYHPWLAWHDPQTRFRGSALFAFDTATDEVLWWDTLLPGEGCRAMLLDDDRGVLYAISYPRDHLVAFDLGTRRSRDLGRLGSVNSQVLFLDDLHRVWTADDGGRWVRYDPELDRVERSPGVLPHEAPVQDGWHSVLYDAVPDPRTGSVLACTWSTRPRLLRLWPEEGEWGRVEDLGRATPPVEPPDLVDGYTEHVGALAIGPDGALWHVATRWREPRRPAYEDPDGTWGVLVRTDLASLSSREVLRLERPDGGAGHYCSRAAFDAAGDLFLGVVSVPPCGVYRVVQPAGAGTLGLRAWG